MELGKLIRHRRTQLGLTWPKMAERATAAGYPVTRNYLMDVAKNEIKQVPREETLRGIAAAVDLPWETVFKAAGESLGVTMTAPVEIDRGIQVVVGLLEGRTEEERAAIVELVRAQVRLLDVPRTAQLPTASEQS